MICLTFSSDLWKFDLSLIESVIIITIIVIANITLYDCYCCILLSFKIN